MGTLATGSSANSQAAGLLLPRHVLVRPQHVSVITLRHASDRVKQVGL
jgi:hypothetical protein